MLGAANLDTRGPGSLVMTSFNYILHPGYDPSTLANDLAIVQLPIGIDVRSSRDIPAPHYPSVSQISSLISPISLPEPGQTPTSDVVTILGWGKQGDTGGVSPDLKYVEVSLSQPWPVTMMASCPGDQDIPGRLLRVLRPPGPRDRVCDGPQHLSGDTRGDGHTS